MEVLFPEKTAHFGSTVPGKNSAFWKYCSRKKRQRLSRLSRASVSQAMDKLKLTPVKRILEVLFPEKTAHFGSTVPGKNSAFWKYCSRKKRQRLLRASAPGAHAGPILPFFSGDSTSIFPGIVLPFCYFSVVRKVPEKPVLFLPHPKLRPYRVLLYKLLGACTTILLQP